VVATDWAGSLYITMRMAWNYINHTVDISIPEYISKALGRFQHRALGRPQHSHHAWFKPQYYTHPQLTTALGDTAILPQPELMRIQEVIGTLLFYGCAIYSKMMVVLGTIASKQTKVTQATTQAITQLELRFSAPRRHSLIPCH
jgi:hypothetical protein